MAAVKNPVCPVCGETFKDGRGVSGHLQFKHGLSGDEHREALDEAMSRGQDEESLEGVRLEGKVYQDSRMQAVENLRVAMEQLERAEKRKEALRQSSGGSTEITGIAVSTWQEVKRETREQIDEEISRMEERVEERKKQLDQALQTEVDRRE
jgi:hypothetical protein